VALTRYESTKQFEQFLADTTIKSRPVTRLVNQYMHGTEPATRLKTISHSGLRASPCDEMPSRSLLDNDEFTIQQKNELQDIGFGTLVQ
jgi:hypothetical protein